MADIELVIRIDEGIYNHFVRNEYSRADVIAMHAALINATPLPKGHGRLKDFDKIEWYGCDLEGRGCIEAKGDCSVCNHANCYAKQVRELPTIIEADKAECEEKE